MSFQESSEGIHGMAQQEKISGLFQEEKKVCPERTLNELKMLELVREIDKFYEL